MSSELRMADDIARQFGHLGTDEAGRTVAAHITRFWAPAMIDRLCAEVAEAGEVDPVVAVAVACLTGDPSAPVH
ncbi:MAG: formate dehydrogenase subunit delta [Thermoleophilia bacterium]